MILIKLSLADRALKGPGDLTPHPVEGCPSLEMSLRTGSGQSRPGV
jgi:hypothetical protein